MGQYFYAVNADTFEYVSPTREGLKLMEHSYQGNHFMLRVDRLLRPGGKWYMARLVWAGDSAPTEPNLLRQMNGQEENVNIHNYVQYSSTGRADGDLMMPCGDPASHQHGCYILNHDMREFVCIEHGSAVHPLPVLTSTGGGYCGADGDKEGRWKECRISIQDTPPSDGKFKELKVAFH